MVVNCICNMFCCCITFSLIWYITCDICCNDSCIVCYVTKVVYDMKCMLYNIPQPSRWINSFAPKFMYQFSWISDLYKLMCVWIYGSALSFHIWNHIMMTYEFICEFGCSKVPWPNGYLYPGLPGTAKAAVVISASCTRLRLSLIIWVTDQHEVWDHSVPWPCCPGSGPPIHTGRKPKTQSLVALRDGPRWQRSDAGSVAGVTQA